MNICLHMIYILGMMLWTRILQASDGNKPLLPAYVCGQEVTILLQEKVSPTGRHKLIWSPTNQKARSQKMNILIYNIVICGL